MNNCFGKYDPYRYGCKKCGVVSICKYSTEMKKPAYTFSAIEKGYTVRDADSYEDLVEGDLVAIADELDGVAVVTVLSKCEQDEFDILVRVNDLAKLYKVEQMSDTLNGVTFETVTDKYKKVYVTMKYRDMEAEGIASCNPMDKFNLEDGFALAKIRANKLLLNMMEERLVSSL